jgi:hypothetical protein
MADSSQQLWPYLDCCVRCLGPYPSAASKMATKVRTYPWGRAGSVVYSVLLPALPRRVWFLIAASAHQQPISLQMGAHPDTRQPVVRGMVKVGIVLPANFGQSGRFCPAEIDPQRH